MSSLKRDGNCTLCRLHKTAEYVCLLGQGPVPCKVMIVGEAPGKREDESGIRFVGKSEQLLERVLATHGFDRENVFITNAVSCRPPDNRTPTKAEIRHCSAWLSYQIRHVKPKAVLLLGNVPLQSITGEGGIKKKRGRPFERDGITYFPTYHPSYCLRFPEMEDILSKDVETFKQIVKYGGVPREDRLNPTYVDTREKFTEMLRCTTGEVSFDLETSCLYPWAPDARILLLGIGTKEGEFSLPLKHKNSPWTEDEQDQMLAALTEKVKHCKLDTSNGKFDFLWLWVHYGLEWHHYWDFDTQYAHYLWNENEFRGLKHLAQKYEGAPEWDIDKGDLESQPIEKTVNYHCHDLFYTRRLCRRLRKMLAEDVEIDRLMRELMMPVARLFVEVEYDGVCIDHAKFGEVEKYLREKKDAAEQKLKKWGDINWGSTQQVAYLLFDKLGLEPPVKTKKGNPSTGESALNQIDHECVKDLLEFRGAKQQLSFFIEGWKPWLVRRRIGGRWHYFLHPRFKLDGTVTGRPSCENPNLQQVPRDERIRSLIVPPDGWDQVECDLSQIELRIAADLADVFAMKDAFNTGKDIHWITAMSELDRGGGGKYVEVVTRTAQVYLMQQGLPPNRTGTQVLQALWKANAGRVETANLLKSCNQAWSKGGGGIWREPVGIKKWLMEGRMPYLAKEKVSEEIVRALWEYQVCRLASQKREQVELEKIKFTDALSVVSLIGPSISEELQKSWGEKDPDKLWKEIRKKAKAVNFGYLFSMFWKKFKKYALDNYGVKLTDQQAEESYDNYFSLYPELKDYHKRQRAFAYRYGYVSTYTGRKRRLPDAQIKYDCPQRGEAERQAINSPVQGFAAELLLMTAIQLRSEFSRDIVRIVGTIHDAVIFWVKKGHTKRVAERCLEIMKWPKLMDTFEIEFEVPIMGEAKVGPWGANVALEKWK